MKRNFKLGPRFICFAFILVCFWMMVNVNPAYAKWNFGIGTGISRADFDGDIGFNTLKGPVTFDFELDPDDVSDLMTSGFGFGGYATDGTWTIQYGFSNLVLEGDNTAVLPDATVAIDVEFDKTGFVITVGRPVIKRDYFVVALQGGVRYTDHELSIDNIIFRTNSTDIYDMDIDESWVDVLIGGSIGVPINDEWVWNSLLNVGFGGSEGTVYANTGLTWRFLKSWSASLNAAVTAVDYENDDKGDNYWYLYDVDESTVGLLILFHW